MTATDWSVPIGDCAGDHRRVDRGTRARTTTRCSAGFRRAATPQVERRGARGQGRARRRAARARGSGPRSSTGPRSSSSERTEDLARIIATESAKPIKTARVEAQRAVSTFTFAAVAARTLAGDVVPMDASAAGDGKLAFTLRVPIGVVGAISPFNFPLNLVAHKLAPAIAAGLPGGAEAREPDAALGDHARAACCSTSAASRPATSTS